MDFLNFFYPKTDLADENDEILRSQNKDLSGIESYQKNVNGFKIFTMNVKNKHGEKISGKKIGNYITLNIGNPTFFNNRTFDDACSVCSTILHKISKKYRAENELILLVGLGNPSIVADCLGSETVKNFIVTRHIKQCSNRLFEKFGFCETAAIIPDVYGNTGIEAAETIKGIANDIKPTLIIAVDALSSRRLSRLTGSIQISDTGICPGSGVGNPRGEVSFETIGVPVISIGVPTVVNASTLMLDILNDCGIDEENLDQNQKEKIFSQIGNDCFVSPKDCGKEIKSMARLIGYSLNATFQKNISLSEMKNFL